MDYFKPTVLITGAAKGIGASIAEKFAKKGYNLVLTYLTSKQKAMETATKLASITRVEVYHLDVSNSNQVEYVFDCARKVFGSIDVVINNAGIALYKLFTDTTDDEWKKVLTTNLDGVFYVCREAVKSMLSLNGGSIVNISSIWGVEGGSMEVAYSASKAGVIGLTRALAKECELNNIRVNCIAVGATNTDMIPEDIKVDMIENSSFNKLLEPKDVAEKVYKLATNAKLNGKVVKFY